jgi:predicted porin
MQKKLIALAVAGMASGFAAAQTNVTIYGVLDAGYLYSSGNPGPGIKGTNTFSGDRQRTHRRQSPGIQG